MGLSACTFPRRSASPRLEYRRLFGGTGAEEEPKLTFVAEVDLRRVIDLEKPEVRGALDLSAADFFESWREAASPTRLQRLGLAVSRQRDVSAIRYPSDACRRARSKGWNVVIFPEAVVAPDRVWILGRSGAALEELS